MVIEQWAEDSWEPRVADPYMQGRQELSQPIPTGAAYVCVGRDAGNRVLRCIASAWFIGWWKRLVVIVVDGSVQCPGVVAAVLFIEHYII